MRKEDPCIWLCEFDWRTGWGKGCGVTVAEIKGVEEDSPFRRSGLIRELPRRVFQVTGTAAGN